MSELPASTILPRDGLATYGRAFDQARGITPNLRAAINWLFVNGSWLKRSDAGWHAVRDGRPSVEALPDALVVDLVNVGAASLYDAIGNKLPNAWTELAQLARLERLS